MGFLNFLKELPNLEKTRNFNVFKNYDLSVFETYVSSLGLEPNESERKRRISVIGTNGKGSTAYFLSYFLKSKEDAIVGTYTSPHLLHVLERIAINLNAISEEMADSAFLILKEKSEQPLLNLSYFECLTLLAFQVFKMQKCNWEVWEAGLGGRLDATKLCQAETIVLTKIGLDHCEILGNTKEQIVREKIGISGIHTKRLFSMTQGDQALDDFIEKEAKAKGLDFYRFQSTVQFKSYLEENKNYAKFVLDSLKISVPDKVMQSSIQVPGRMEVLRKEPLLLYEPAHNPDAVFSSVAEANPEILIIGILPDKDGLSILKKLESFKNLEIYLIESEGFFRWESLPKTDRTKLLPLSDLPNILGSIKKKALALGSFRLYPHLRSLSF